MQDRIGQNVAVGDYVCYSSCSTLGVGRVEDVFKTGYLNLKRIKPKYQSDYLSITRGKVYNILEYATKEVSPNSVIKISPPQFITKLFDNPLEAAGPKERAKIWSWLWGGRYIP